MEWRYGRRRADFFNQNSEKSLENCFRQNLALGKPKRVLVSMAIGAGWEPDKAREIMNRADGSERKKRAISWGTIGYYLLLLLIISSFTLFYFTDNPTVVIQLPIQTQPISDVVVPTIPTGAVIAEDSPTIVEEPVTDRALDGETIATNEDYIIRGGSGGSGGSSSSSSSDGGSSGSSRSSNYITGDATGTFDPFGSNGGSSGGSSLESLSSSSSSSSSDDEFGVQAFSCDEGDLNTRCNVTTEQTLSLNYISCKNLFINSSAILTFDTELNNLTINCTGNVTINGTINGNGKGFSGGVTDNSGQGPGAGIGGATIYFAGAGGGYGGNGGGANKNWDGRGARYNESIFPLEIGSGGGGGTSSAGGNGGGWIGIQVGQHLIINGNITLTGNDGVDCGAFNGGCGGGGSGGGILINASNITGAGKILATGGDGGSLIAENARGGGGGGGGRIAILYNTYDFSGLVNASGGTKGTGVTDGEDGEFGTFALIDKDDSILTIETYFHVENLTVLNFTTIQFMNGSQTMFDDGDTNIYAQNMTIHSHAILEANGLGYAGGETDTIGYGPGGGSTLDDIYASGSGGGYGGNGGDGYKNEGGGGLRYNESILPLLVGSGGGGGTSEAGGSGGGWIGIQVTNKLLLEGNISARGLQGIGGGVNNGGCGGGGSGGGILINSSILIGTGTISAPGGRGGDCIASGSSGGAGGGGGRILILYDESNFNGFTNVTGGLTGSGARGSNDGEFGTFALIDIDDSILTIETYFHVENLTVLNFSIIEFMNGSYTRFDDGDTSVYAQNMTIHSSAWLEAIGLGYSGGPSDSLGYGPGGGVGTDGIYRSGSGGGYGGIGGDGYGNVGGGGSRYNDSLLPLEVGSGGGGGHTPGMDGGSGGGWIGIQATNKLLLNGNISVNGLQGDGIGGTNGGCGGGGSGGGIIINTSLLYGSGTISAVGGKGGDCVASGSSGGAGGGGGRIALEFEQYLFSGFFNVSEGLTGSGPRGSNDGNPGTVRNRTRIIPSTDVVTSNFNINGTLDGKYISSDDVFGENQTLVFETGLLGRRLGMHVYSGAAVNFSSLVIDSSDSKTAINASGINGLVDMYHTIYVPNNNAGSGVFVCPNAVSVSEVDSSCSDVVEFGGPYPSSKFIGTDRVTVYLDGPDYKITNVTGTGAGNSPLANISIYDDTDLEMGWMVRYVDNMTYFYANWTNKTSGANINHTINSEMSCSWDIDYAGTNNVSMTLNLTNGIYYHNRTFDTAGLFTWNVTCNGTAGGYDVIFASDSVNISSIPPTLLEATFSTVSAANIIVGHEGYYNATWVIPEADIAMGTNITELNFTTNASTTRWQGYYGEIVSQLSIGVDSFTFFNWNSTGAGQDDIVNMIFTSVNENFPFVDATNISDASMIDGAYSFDPTAVDSINETYKYGLEVGGSHTRALDYPNVNYVNGVFGDGTIETVSGSPLNYSWGAKVIANDPDFLGETSDYMLLVPVNQTTVGEGISCSVTYYFFMELK